MFVLTVTREHGKDQRFEPHSELGMRIVRAIALQHMHPDTVTPEDVNADAS